jgi:hypothetical protein
MTSQMRDGPPIQSQRVGIPAEAENLLKKSKIQ